MNRDMEKMLSVTTEISRDDQNGIRSIDSMGKGMRSIYMLSFWRTCEETKETGTDLILVEDPEIFLHPKLQKVTGDILYRLSRKSQVIFSTHAPNLLANFNSRQIRQVLTGKDGSSEVREKTDISEVLDDLGYSANDLMNVNFVFIVEGKQDKNRLPLLIRKYYDETYEEDGTLSRIAIITTKQLHEYQNLCEPEIHEPDLSPDNFLMIRDGDGKDPGN